MPLACGRHLRKQSLKSRLDLHPPNHCPCPCRGSTEIALAQRGIDVAQYIAARSRFLDLVGESLEQFTDAQVGSASRQVIADVRKTLQRMFNIQPLDAREEGSSVEISRPVSPARVHIIGRGSEQATQGTGTSRLESRTLPDATWNGSKEDALVLSPVEIEVDG